MEINDYEFCLRCHRKLKNPEYRKMGYGKICWQKQNEQPELVVKPLIRRKDADSPAQL